MEPLGVHSFWGFSPAVDFQQLYRTAYGSSSWDATSPLNILLVQPGDPRSVLKTIAQRFRSSTRPLHVSAALPVCAQPAKLDLEPSLLPSFSPLPPHLPSSTCLSAPLSSWLGTWCCCP